MTIDEERFRSVNGHSSLCNCIRSWKGRSIVTRRSCSCGGYGMTFQKATAQAIAELGEINEHNRDAIVRRRNKLLNP